MAPVSFLVNGGIVHLVGTVPSIQQKQRIEAIVQRVPGVTRVVNQIQISSTSTTSATSSGLDQDAISTGANSQYGSSVTDAAFSQTNSFSGTSGGFSGTNLMSGTLSQTNLSATGRTNNSNLPPGLRDRETLPPGLEQRDRLPPGLDQRNSP